MSKDTKYKISVMQAYEEGKQIKCKSKSSRCDWVDWILPQEPAWNWENNDYEVKEEPKYRPYVDTEEMINDFCERSGAKRSKMGEPFIWIKNGEDKILIIKVEKNIVYTTNNCPWSMKELFGTYTYCDGSPIGKKE